MRHIENDKKNKKSGVLNKVISLIAVAAVFTMLGTGIGTNTAANNALAEAQTETTAQTEADAAGDATQYDSPAIAVYEKCADSVVGVITYTEQWSRSTGEVQKAEVGEGSGVVISDDGYIMTNNHVVADGNSYQVLLPSGDKVDASLVGTDSGTDIAVLKVEDQTLKAIDIGSSADLKVGETVIAIGNPGGSTLANTVTQGIVSALERDMANTFTRTVKTIQHDAAINPGNSGGALLNTKGQLVGINTLKYTGSSYSTTTYEGLGFAIPIDTALPIAQQLIDYGEVRRPALGITCGTFSGPDNPISSWPPASVVISEVTADGPADEAGLKAYDFITEVDGTRITSLHDLTAVLDTHKEGDTISVTVLRYKNTNAIISILNSAYNNYYGGNSGYGYGSGYGNSYGGFFGGNGGYNTNSSLDYDTVTVDVTLKVLASTTEADTTDAD